MAKQLDDVIEKFASYIRTEELVQEQTKQYTLSYHISGAPAASGHVTVTCTLTVAGFLKRLTMDMHWTRVLIINLRSASVRTPKTHLNHTCMARMHVRAMPKTINGSSRAAEQQS